MTYQPQDGGFRAAPSMDDQYGTRGPVTRPQPVATAVKLMWAGAGLSLLSLLLGLVLRPSAEEFRQAMEDAGIPMTDAQLDQQMTMGMVSGVVFGLIGVGLWALHAWANGKGMAWARITGTILGVLNIGLFLFSLLGLAVSLATASGIVSLVLSAISAVLAAVIIYLLWRPENKAFYAAG
ncbi:hypothetical protein BJF82_02340 [Kytococcus sp. CUA-901]|nr:hypothetical protein BJF82_02340 [Kytococcus sp. CUA-901]